MSRKSLLLCRLVPKNEPSQVGPKGLSWKQVLTRMEEAATSMEALIQHINKIKDTLPLLKLNITNVLLSTDDEDYAARPWIPRDCPVRNGVPLETQGDGNCLLHAFSRQLFEYTSVERVAELRVRLVIEGVTNRDWYLSHKKLTLGMTVAEMQSPAQTTYALMSGAYDYQNSAEDVGLIYNRMMVNYTQAGIVSLYP